MIARVQRMLPCLIAAALIVQWLPLRACAVERILTGSNCHAGEALPTVPAAGCHEHRHPADRDCACEMPKDPIPRPSDRGVEAGASMAASNAFESPATSVDAAAQSAAPVPGIDASPPSLQNLPLR